MSQPLNPIDLAAEKRDSATADAREQAAEYDSFAAGTFYTTPTGEKFPVFVMSLLDDEQQERFNELQFVFNNCDRVPDADIPESTITDPEGNAIHTPARTIKSQLFIQPFQKDGELIRPPYAQQLVVAMLGEEGYERFKAAKGRSNEYSKAIQELNGLTANREVSDSKSADSTGDVAPVSD